MPFESRAHANTKCNDMLTKSKCGQEIATESPSCARAQTPCKPEAPLTPRCNDAWLADLLRPSGIARPKAPRHERHRPGANVQQERAAHPTRDDGPMQHTTSIASELIGRGATTRLLVSVTRWRIGAHTRNLGNARLQYISACEQPSHEELPIAMLPERANLRAP